MAKKAKGNKTKIAIAAGIVAVAAGAIFTVKTPTGQSFQAQSYQVTSVSDGDTLKLLSFLELD